MWAGLRNRKFKYHDLRIPVPHGSSTLGRVSLYYLWSNHWPVAQISVLRGSPTVDPLRTGYMGHPVRFLPRSKTIWVLLRCFWGMHQFYLPSLMGSALGVLLFGEATSLMFPVTPSGSFQTAQWHCQVAFRLSRFHELQIHTCCTNLPVAQWTLKRCHQKRNDAHFVPCVQKKHGSLCRDGADA